MLNEIQQLLRGQPVGLGDIAAQILATLFVIFCILPVHECAHAWAAAKLGDSTAKAQGRLTLNPLASFDPVGALFLLLFGFGWAKPVPIDSRYFKNPRRDTALTALAGPLSNFLAAWAGAIVFYAVFLAARGLVPELVSSFFKAYIVINVGLAVFNLIPLPPLDGSKILGAFLSSRALYNYYRYQRIIVMVAFIVLFLGFLNGPINFLVEVCYRGIWQLGLLPFRLFGLA